MSGELEETQFVRCWLPTGRGNRRDGTEWELMGGPRGRLLADGLAFWFCGEATAGIWAAVSDEPCCSITCRREEALRNHVIPRDHRAQVMDRG